MTKYILVILLVIPHPVQADEKQVANIISYGTVFTNIGIDTYHSFKSDDKKKAFLKQGARTGLIIASSELVKYFIHEDRPDHSDNKSFWSEHSGLGCATTSLDRNDGWEFKIGVTMAVATPIGRILAEKHHWWDTVVGCGAGLLFNRLVR